MSTPLEAPTSPPDAPEAPEAPEVGQGSQDAPAPSVGPRRGYGLRAAKGEAARVSRALKHTPESRARVLAAISAEVSGERGAPVPLAIACRAHGISPLTVEEWLQKGEAMELDAARARGIMAATRAATGVGPDARQWAWLAERLAPKELHLPSKITGLSPEDGGHPIEARVAIDITDARALARGQVQVTSRALGSGKKPPP